MEPRTRTTGRTPLGWLGILAVLLALVATLNQASKAFADIREQERQVGELQALADRQERAGDFPAAWTSLERASAATERGGYIARLAGRPAR